MRDALSLAIYTAILVSSTVITLVSIVPGTDFESYDETCNNIAVTILIGGGVPSLLFLAVLYTSITKPQTKIRPVAPYLTILSLVLLNIAHVWWTVRMGQTYFPGRVLWQCLLCVAPVQVLAWLGVTGEVWWKKTDYVWVSVALIGLLCGTLPRVRAEVLRNGEEAYAHAVEQAKSRIALLTQEKYWSPAMEDWARAVRQKGKPEYEVRDERYRTLLAEAVRSVSQADPRWTADGLEASIPHPEFETTDLDRVAQTHRAIQRLREVESEHDWYTHGGELTPAEKFGSTFAPLAICVAIALRLGKTSAEVRKLYASASPAAPASAAETGTAKPDDRSTPHSPPPPDIPPAS